MSYFILIIYWVITNTNSCYVESHCFLRSFYLSGERCFVHVFLLFCFVFYSPPPFPFFSGHLFASLYHSLNSVLLILFCGLLFFFRNWNFCFATSSKSFMHVVHPAKQNYKGIWSCLLKTQQWCLNARNINGWFHYKK